MDIISSILDSSNWEEFISYRLRSRHLTKAEARSWREFIDAKVYLPLAEQLADADFIPPLPAKIVINKTGSSKKRTVYSYPDDFNRILKYICYALYRYDSVFSGCCYAFRPTLSVKDAIRKISTRLGSADCYCLKADISDYFNSIDTGRLLERLSFLKEEDGRLYGLFEKMLTADAALDAKENELHLKRGAMAGIPVAPFFANVYLNDTDRYFEKQDLLYLRYSDDILICADSRERLETAKAELLDRLAAEGLKLNPDKLCEYGCGEAVEYLGFRIGKDGIDLSGVTMTKMKDKMRRKAHSLRRWAIEKKLPPERGAKGFITAMNHKLYTRSEDNAFSWSRWFFPCITTDESLKELDAYMQQYVRWCVSGRHYKGNYRISYDTIKSWGYKSLVHEYHSGVENIENSQ